MWGLGRPQSKVGKFFAKHGYNIQEISKASKVNRNTVGKICSDPDFEPTAKTIKKIMGVIRELKPDAKVDDFFKM